MTPRKLISEWRKARLASGMIVEVQTQKGGNLRHPDEDWDGGQERLSDVMNRIKIGDIVSLVVYRRFGHEDRELVDFAHIRVHPDRVELIAGLD